METVLLKEVGIDLTAAKPGFLSEELAARAGLLVTMGCGEACPHLPRTKKVDWPIDDRKGQSREISGDPGRNSATRGSVGYGAKVALGTI